MSEVYYRVYTQDGALRSKASTQDDPCLGRIKVTSVPPPHTVDTLKNCLASSEDIADIASLSLFRLTQSSQSPMDDTCKITIRTRTGPGSSPQEPMVLVANLPHSERSKLEYWDLSGSSERDSDVISPNYRHRKSLVPSRLWLQYCLKCTIGCMPSIVRCHQNRLSTLRNLPLVASLRILFRRPPHPRPSSDISRE
jgi:hypothetical protein